MQVRIEFRQVHQPEERGVVREIVGERLLQLAHGHADRGAGNLADRESMFPAELETEGSPGSARRFDQLEVDGVGRTISRPQDKLKGRHRAFARTVPECDALFGLTQHLKWPLDAERVGRRQCEDLVRDQHIVDELRRVDASIQQLVADGFAPFGEARDRALLTRPDPPLE